MVRQINLTESKGKKVDELARQTGWTLDEIVNSAIAHLAPDDSHKKTTQDWKKAWRPAAGMWKDRVDFPILRNSADHGIGWNGLHNVTVSMLTDELGVLCKI